MRTLCANTEIVQNLSLVGRRVTLGSKVLRSLLNPLSTLCWLQELSHNLLQWELRRDEHRHQPFRWTKKCNQTICILYSSFLSVVQINNFFKKNVLYVSRARLGNIYNWLKIFEPNFKIVCNNIIIDTVHNWQVTCMGNTEITDQKIFRCSKIFDGSVTNAED